MRRIAVRLGVSISSVSLWVRDISAPAAARPETPEPPEPSTTQGSRRCGRCRVDLPLTSFNRHSDGHQWWCRDCFREYFRQRGDLHRRQSGSARARRRQAARAYVAEHLAAHPCVDCGERDPSVLDFDHLDQKRDHVNRLAWDGRSLPELTKEIARCEIRCANCHRRRTARQVESWRLHPEKLNENARLLSGEVRNLILVRDTLLASACVDCNETDLLVLDFDHIASKRDSVPALARRGVRLETLKREISCCVVRCANCHRRRTAAGRSGQAQALS
jgi:hypothetical protein